MNSTAYYSRHQFDLDALKSGDLAQLELFRCPIGPRSIYIEWVPDQMTEETVKSYFASMGDVVGIDFVNHKTGRARMLFVHFESFHRYDDPNVAGITKAYPNAYEMPISFDMFTQNKMYRKNYTLKCRINMTPTPRVEYNMAQLTEMVDRLRTDLETFKTDVSIMKRRLNVEKLEDETSTTSYNFADTIIDILSRMETQQTKDEFQQTLSTVKTKIENGFMEVSQK